MPAVLLCGMALGAKRAAVSTAVYLVAGLLGLPVFSNFSGGLAYAARPTFGFVVAFVPAAFVVGLLCERPGKPTVPVCMMAAAAGFAIIYAIGILYHYLAFALWLHAPQGFLPLFLGAGYALLIPKDFAAAVLVSLIGPRIKKYSLED
jgi:biotin transport system substrate-specific component